MFEVISRKHLGMKLLTPSSIEKMQAFSISVNILQGVSASVGALNCDPWPKLLMSAGVQKVTSGLLFERLALVLFFYHLFGQKLTLRQLSAETAKKGLTGKVDWRD